MITERGTLPCEQFTGTVHMVYTALGVPLTRVVLTALDVHSARYSYSTAPKYEVRVQYFVGETGKRKAQELTVTMTIAMVVVKMALAWLSLGKSWTACRARANAMAPRRPGAPHREATGRRAESAQSETESERACTVYGTGSCVVQYCAMPNSTVFCKQLVRYSCLRPHAIQGLQT